MPTSNDAMNAADALVAALAALRKAESAVEQALSYLRDELPARPADSPIAQRSTSVQVLAVLSRSKEAMTIGAIADGVLAIRRDEDEPRKHGQGTRYEELCRSAILRMIKDGLVERVPPASKHERMRFRRSSSEPMEQG